jgi:hypothetical protein
VAGGRRRRGVGWSSARRDVARLSNKQSVAHGRAGRSRTMHIEHGNLNLVIAVEGPQHPTQSTSKYNGLFTNNV